MDPPKPPKPKIEVKCAATTSGNRNIVPPILKEVSKLAAGVAAVATGSSTGNPRNKCALQPGHSLMDWIRLGASGRDLTGVGDRAGTLMVTPRELAKHSGASDAWIAIRGRVYNVTSYLPFHPGGMDELMRGVGKDATSLFNEVHAWVNYEQILQKCYIGRLSSLSPDIDREALFLGREPSPRPKSTDSERGGLKPRTNGSTTNSPGTNFPRFDWIQKTDNLTTIFYTKNFSNPQVRVTNPSKQNEVNIYLTYGNCVYENNLHFSYDIHWPCKVGINFETGKVEVTFRKIASKIWESYGILHQSKKDGTGEERVKYVIVHKLKVNYNCCLFSLQRIDGNKQTIPVGQHIRVFGNYKGEEISRSYTPIPCSFVRKDNPDALTGDVCLLVKGYSDGALSPTICASRKGDSLELSNPVGSFDLKEIENKEAFLMLAAGTGLTPMLGLLTCVLERRTRRCQKVTLMFFNRTEEDIILKDQLDKLVANDNDRFEVQHILSDPSESWEGDRGHINESYLKSAIDRQCSSCTVLFPADIFVTICGPAGFTELARNLLQEMGYQKQHMHCFLG